MYTQFDDKNPNFLDLQSGAPNRDMMDLAAVQDSSSLALDPSLWRTTPNGLILNDHVMQYGSNQGDPDVRNAIANLFRNKYPTQKDLDPQNIMLHGGASQGFATVLAWLTRPQNNGSSAPQELPHILLTTATYYLAIGMLRDVGINLKSQITVISEEQDGVNVDELEKYLSDSSAARKNAKYQYLLYIVPTHSNPTGTILSEVKRKRLVELGAHYQLLVLSDDVYELLDFPNDKNVIPRIAWFDQMYGNGKSVISNCSFSKVLGPGLRLGYFEAHPSIVQQLCDTGWIRSGGGPNHFVSRLILPLFLPTFRNAFTSNVPAEYETRFEHMLAKLQVHLRDRCYRLVEALKKYLVPLGFGFPYGIPHGGYFVFLSCPADLDSSMLQDAFLQASVYVSSSDRFSLDPQKLIEQVGSDCVRLSFTFYDESKLDERLHDLSQRITSLRSTDELL